MSYKNPFQTGFKGLDNALNGFQQDSLVVVGGLVGMGLTTFGMSLMEIEESRQKGHFISLYSTFMALEDQFPELLSQPETKTRMSFLEQPRLLDLLEYIVEVNANRSPDFFIVDSLDFIGSKKNKFLSSKKNYQKNLRHLRVLAKTLYKPIVLLTSINPAIQSSDPFLYPRITHREKYVDYILILYRWEYYGKTICTEYGYEIAKNQVLVIIGKSAHVINNNYAILNFDEQMRIYLDNRE